MTSSFGRRPHETEYEGPLRDGCPGRYRAATRGQLVTLGDIAQRQDVSLPYLEQLFVKLRRAGLVASVRGPGGGYRLSRPASEIRVVDVLGPSMKRSTRCTRGRASRRGCRGAGRNPDEPAVGRAVGACLRVSAPDPAVRRGWQFIGALSCGAKPFRRGGRGWDRIGWPIRRRLLSNANCGGAAPANSPPGYF